MELLVSYYLWEKKKNELRKQYQEQTKNYL